MFTPAHALIALSLSYMPLYCTPSVPFFSSSHRSCRATVVCIWSVCVCDVCQEQLCKSSDIYNIALSKYCLPHFMFAVLGLGVHFCELLFMSSEKHYPGVTSCLLRDAKVLVLQLFHVFSPVCLDYLELFLVLRLSSC